MQDTDRELANRLQFRSLDALLVEIVVGAVDWNALRDPVGEGLVKKILEFLLIRLDAA